MASGKRFIHERCAPAVRGRICLITTTFLLASVPSALSIYKEDLSYGKFNSPDFEGVSMAVAEKDDVVFLMGETSIPQGSVS